MAMTTLNINVNVPPGKIDMSELTHQVTIYAQFVVSNMTAGSTPKKQRFSSFKGVLSGSKHASDKELLDEYLQKKYGL